MSKPSCRNLVLACALAVGLAPGLARAAEHKPLADAEIQSRIEHDLSDKAISGASVSVEDGIVTLAGQVTSAWDRRQADRVAARTADVQDVVDRMTIARAESDKDVSDEVSRRIRNSIFFTVFDDVNVGVKDGKVRLEGRVTAENKSEEFADEAARVFGVQGVDNQIEVLPASNFDDQLRWTIAREIYSDVSFVGLASSHAAPIHVVVEHGQVTLTGVVGSQVEKRKAEFIARDTFGVLGVTNRIRVE